MKTAPCFLVITLCVFSVFAQTVTPQSKDNGLFYLQCANVYLEIDSTVGGRISSLKVDGQELMFINRSYAGGPYWGSCLWLSPQDGKERPAEVDQNFYTGGIRSKEIVLSGSTARAIPVSVTKKLSADSTDTSLTITYEIINHGTTALSRSAWELTRVLPSGSLTFWPTGDYLSGGLASRVTASGSYKWYAFQASDPSNGTKFFADGKEGWYGHVTGGRVLFVKKFIDVPRSQQAPNEAEIELWLSGDHQYIELENQSRYQQIAPNDTLRYTIKWYLRKLPPAVTVSAGSQSLLEYARMSARIDTLPSVKTRPSQAQAPRLLSAQSRMNALLAGRTGAGIFTLRGARLVSAHRGCIGLSPGIYLFSHDSRRGPAQRVMVP